MSLDGVVQVPLGRYGDKGYTLVDADRAAEVVGYCWSVRDGYAKRDVPQAGGKRRTILLHRQLLDVLDDKSVEVDHIYGDRLDNRLRNLRLVSRASNCQNLNFCNTGTSRFRGVSWRRETETWQAKVQLDRKQRSLGLFDSEIAAAQVAEEWRLEHMPFAEPDPELLKFYEECCGSAA